MRLLQDFINEIEKQNMQLNAVMVLQKEQLLDLQRFHGREAHNVFSVAKSFTSTAIGMAVDEGILKLTDRPYDMFEELIPEDMKKHWEEVTLYHLLTMTSGHGKPHLMAADRKILRGETMNTVPSAMMEEWLRFAFICPMIDKPGTKMSYGNLAPYVAGRMLEKASGCTICDYLYEKFWKLSGTAKPRWDCDLKGHTFAASDLYLDIEDMSRLGQLYLGKGELEGRRYLSEKWVDQATASLTDSHVIGPCKNAKDEICGYGFYFWQNSYPGSYRAFGREGQLVIVLPDKAAVISVQAMHSDVQQILNTIWSQILPHL
jgi:CubicO group peptidase (beta-lactamase class C family)